MEAETPEGSAAVAATAGEVVLYGDEVAQTFFHSSSGGRTVAYSEVYPGSTKYPYLASVSDPYDTASPYHNWGPVLVDGTKAAKALGVPGGQLLDLTASPGPSGHVATAIARGSSGDVQVTGAKARFALGLRSTWFQVTGLLSLSRPYGPLAYGSSTTLTGRGRGLTGLSLEQRSGSAWQASAPITPASDGSFTVSVNPSVTTSYRLASGTVKAFPLRVTVAPVVTLALAPDLTALVGTTSPAVPNGIVEVQREDGVVWTTVTTATIDFTGGFRIALPLAPGTYRARFAPGSGLVAGTSPPLVVS
jgi:hypothetical protein